MNPDLGRVLNVGAASFDEYMLIFRAADPFPLLDLSTFRSGEIFAHSAACDRWLGFDIEKCETALAHHGCRARARNRNAGLATNANQQIWLGLDPQMLQTPYAELRAVLKILAPREGQRVVDLGAAYGRMGFVLARHHPGVEFVGYEYVGERVHEANRVLAKFRAGNARVEHVDLSAADFVPKPADFYFLYDYGTLKAIEKTLYDLKRLALQSRRPVTVVVRGRHSRYLIARNHPWLRATYPDQGEGRITIYSAESEASAAQVGEWRASV